MAIVGAGGGPGLLGCQFAKALGLTMLGIDAREEGLALAGHSGADVVIDARREKEKLVDKVMKFTNGMRADVTVNVSDDGQAAALACTVTKMHGTGIQIAQPTEVSVPFHELVFRDVRIKCSLICSRSEADHMLETVAEHKISVRTNTFFGVGETPKLLELAHSGKMQGKAIVIIDEEEMKWAQEGKTGRENDFMLSFTRSFIPLGISLRILNPVDLPN